ncbi:transposase mutator type, partial [mine drainage metagenome]
TTLQTCIVHLIRNSLEYASWKDRKILAQALRPIYTATTAEAAVDALEEFERGSWGERYPTIAALWRRAWDRVIPFFAFPPAVRRVIYTADEIDKPHDALISTAALPPWLSASAAASAPQSGLGPRQQMKHSSRV